MKKTVMVVDDEEVVRKTLTAVFMNAGYSVCCATNGKEVLDSLDEHDIRVFFLDLKMPGMNGVDLCRRIKELRPIAFVFAITAYVPEFHVEWCRRAGFDDYFVKPFDIEMIVSAANSAFLKLRRWDAQMKA
jgi:CheY-like chemotaxis protein